MGRSEHGVDCVGLLLCAAKDCGIEPEMPAPYARGHRGYDLLNACERIGNPIAIDKTEDGDVLVFADGLYPAHMGIRSTLSGIPHVIHARLNRRKVVEEPLTHELSEALRRAFRPAVFEKADD